ncbi:MAG TPA: HAD-IIIC family phosphatase [Myxococcota bacterium]|nr:HAD-IIIC family phosphatase [Myxococcota bacterium]
MTNGERASALETLGRASATMVEVLAALRTLDGDEALGPMRRLRIGVVANISVDLLGPYLRRHGYLAGARLEVVTGSYDDLLNDVRRLGEEGVDHLLVVPFFDNLRPAFEAQLPAMSEGARDESIGAWLDQLALALEMARTIGRVTVLGPHLLGPDGAGGEVGRALAAFDRGLRETVSRHANAAILNTTDLVAQLGRAAFDLRFYYRSKAPYTPAFFDALARRYSTMSRGFGGHFYKVLALDCDNTLWGGIVGEDGLEGIALDPYGYPGNIFWRVQHRVRHLESCGVLVGLVSKNNPADVDEVFSRHPSAVLNDRHFAFKKVGWQPKAESLEALATELGLGLESFLFVDDSAFELEGVRARLPMVKTMAVPSKLADYPALFDEIAALFLGPGEGAGSRTEQYRRLAEARIERTSFGSHEDYLRSLALRVRVHRDARAHIARVAELSQKSNQFNLTTRRYSPGEITALMEREETSVYTFEVADRFGDCGLTGIIIVDFGGEEAIVEAFLMSCRVIGRGVEFAVWRPILAEARRRGLAAIVSEFIPTAKNGQVADFYDRLGFSRTEVTGAGVHRYRAMVGEVRLAESAWVELRDD